MDYISEKIGLYDYMILFEKAQKRQKQNYLMQIAIARNPHTKNPNELVDQLRDDTRPDYVQQEKLDKAAFAVFKQRISQSPNVIIK